jgi:hypothetical protein
MSEQKQNQQIHKQKTLTEMFTVEQLIKMGIQPPFVSIDKSVFIKTPEEREKVKAAKAAYKHNSQLVME